MSKSTPTLQPAKINREWQQKRSTDNTIEDREHKRQEDGNNSSSSIVKAIQVMGEKEEATN